MSKTAEDVSASLSSAEPTLEPNEAIAALLIGEDEALSGDDTDDENLSKASNQDDDDDSNEELEAKDDGEEEETTLEAVADEGDPTWESTLGVSEGDLSFDEEGNINGFNTKVNGESVTVGAKDLIAGFQNAKHTTQQNQAHAETVKEFNIQRDNAIKLYSSRLASVDALSEHFEKQLVSEFDGVNWDLLRKNDPAEYAAARHDFSVKAGELQKIKDAIESDKATQGQELTASKQQVSQEYKQGQFNAMIAKNPEWKDEKTLTKARGEFKTFVDETYGFKAEEFDLVFDARLIELIKDARKYHNGLKVAEKKMIKPVPKFQKSRGKGVKPKVSKLEKLTRAASKAQGGEKRDLQASAVAELLIGGT